MSQKSKRTYTAKDVTGERGCSVVKFTSRAVMAKDAGDYFDLILRMTDPNRCINHVCNKDSATRYHFALLDDHDDWVNSVAVSVYPHSLQGMSSYKNAFCAKGLRGALREMRAFCIKRLFDPKV